MKKIIITIGQDGKLDLEAEGYHGKGCEQATAFLEKALGSVKARKKKPVYFQQQTTAATQKASR